MKAIKDSVLVALPPKVTETKGKILIPGNSEQRNWYGRVFAVGRDCKEVEVGDIVVFHKAGMEQVEYGTLTRSKEYEEAGFISLVEDMVHGIHSEAEAERLELVVPSLEEIEKSYGLDPI